MVRVVVCDGEGCFELDFCVRVIERTHSWSRVRESDLRERAVVRGILFFNICI